MRIDQSRVRLAFLDEFAGDALEDVLDALARTELPPEQHAFCLPASAVLEKSRADPSRRTFAILLDHRDHAEVVGVGVLQANSAGSDAWPSREPHVFLRGFSVDARFQGQGVGTAATREAVALARRTFPAASALVLTVHVDNLAGQRAYERAGFAQTGRRVPGRSGDEHVMFAGLAADESAATTT